MSELPTSSEVQQSPTETAPRQPAWQRTFAVVGLLFVFLCAVSGLSSGFKTLGHGVLDSFFQATGNPFIGLVIGILGTTLVQSSSVTTSMIVALVAAPGSPLPIENAVPMVMGANIGTTVTNTVVALGHMGRPDEFRRAFAAATCHDFFNFITVAILLPLELTTGILTRVSGEFAGTLSGLGGGKLPNPVKAATGAVVHAVSDALHAVFGEESSAPAILLIILSVLGIFATLALLVRVLRASAGARLKGVISGALEASPLLAIAAGAIMTVAVQSSSITTSVLVPLAGAGLVTVRQVFPITLGANVGTTMTALLASMAAPTETAHLAVQIALVHLLFNVLGILLVFPLKATREVPVRLAQWLAELATRSRKLALIYVVGLFYGLPAALVVVSRAWGP